MVGGLFQFDEPNDLGRETEAEIQCTRLPMAFCASWLASWVYMFHLGQRASLPLLCALQLGGHVLMAASSKPFSASGEVLHTVGGREGSGSRSDAL